MNCKESKEERALYGTHTLALQHIEFKDKGLQDKKYGQFPIPTQIIISPQSNY